MRISLSLATAAAIAAVVAPVAVGDRFITPDSIDARPPVLPVAIPATCAFTYPASGGFNLICRGITPTPPAKTTTLTRIPCGPLPYTGKGTLVVRKSGAVMLSCRVP